MMLYNFIITKIKITTICHCFLMETIYSDNQQSYCLQKSTIQFKNVSLATTEKQLQKC